MLACPALAKFVGSGPVLVAQGDLLLRERLGALNDDFTDRNLDALILRPDSGMGPNTAAIAGCIIGPVAYAALRCAVAAFDDALPQLGVDGARIGVREVDACMPCRGGAEELLEANRRMLDQLAPRTTGERVFESRIQGRVSIHPSAEIRSSIIRGPVAIGAGARVSDAYIGPYTAIGAGVEIDSVEIEHSIVFDRARIQFIASRIEGSLVGPGATVTRDFQLPRALRLAIGEGAQVTLA